MTDITDTKKICVLVNKVSLVEQTQAQLAKMIDDGRVGVYCGTLKTKEIKSQVTVATIQSIARQSPHIDLLIIDEYHNFTESKRSESFIEKLKQVNPRLRIVGFTATPFTAKNGPVFGKGQMVQELTYERSLDEMIADEYLVPYRFEVTQERYDTSKLRLVNGDYVEKELQELAKDQGKLSLQVKDALSRLIDRKKVVWIATCIDHAQRLMREIARYESVTIIHSQLKRDEQLASIDSFENGSVKHICSVAMVSEGYDHPPIDAIVLMRPTRSPVLYVQAVGRGLRLNEGKKDCLVLDYGQIAAYLGNPSSPFIGKAKKGQSKRTRDCSCGAVVFLPAKECPECGHDFTPKAFREIDRLKNLTETAGGKVPILGSFFDKFKSMPTDGVLKVKGWEVNENYISSAGNRCFRIKYITETTTVSEYLKHGTYYHKKFIEQTGGDFSTPPISVKVTTNEQGYKNVIERHFQ